MHTYKFSRDVIFIAFAGNLSSTKIKSSKTITMLIKFRVEKMILENETTKILNFDCPQKLYPLKICTYTVCGTGLGRLGLFKQNIIITYLASEG